MNLRVLTWNMSFCYGEGSEGTSGYAQKPKVHFEQTLESMAEFIRNVNIDVVLLQEVDFDSRRSHHIHELNWLARKTDLLYRSELVSWNRAYVPYPGLNPKNHFGRMVSGGGVISRFPIQPVFHELLPKPRENHALYNFFYLHRYLQILRIDVSEKKHFKLMNLHLEAFSGENRELHLVKVQNRLLDYGVDFAGGDFNGSIHLSEAVNRDYAAVQAERPTFPATNPTEVLDGFIVKRDLLSRCRFETFDTGTLSDHFPVLMEIKIGD